jgi:L-amino acid N-acyltransferase YncA
MKVSVRPVREEDAGSIIELLNPLIAERRYTVMDAEIHLAEQVAFIRAFPDRGVFHVAVDSSQELLGLQDVVPISAELSAYRHVGEVSTFVRRHSQRQGIGRALCRATFEAARQRGFEKIMAAVRADNAQAICFYLHQGFKIIGTAQRHACIGGRYIDVVQMENLIGRKTCEARKPP